jgi:hypothetical protein
VGALLFGENHSAGQDPIDILGNLIVNMLLVINHVFNVVHLRFDNTMRVIRRRYQIVTMHHQALPRNWVIVQTLLE